ncbi:Ras-related GTP-binding protein [Galdieria sulphuraria]|uniref:Ras-related GTP-binding protein n=1 Tax=Galdieria sulphuraria TaxID=130081 RepID=M2XTF4_GALSU|nr:Ras-related GTP-binding protein [Galdieria sulphuraria]EME26923.1 Ras-related GTP-binding protein [Galdieria sulphuraria]|eukprot:XP_005703443.1 Ras-related GTP-binding protein [Galdieria sulphuraria]
MDRDTHSLKATVSSYTKYAKDLGPYSVPEEEKVKGNVITESSLSALSQSSKASPSSTNKCNIALGGLARSGKTSIHSVIFHKISPHETLFLESTGRIVKHVVSHSPFCQLELWDLPPELLQSDSESSPSLEDIVSICSALIFVLDTTTETPDETLQLLHQTIVRCYNVNPQIHMEVFIHKTDVLSDEQKLSFQREIQEHVDGELRDIGLDRVVSQVSYRLTSIFDHSIYEAFSQVLEKLHPQTCLLERLLDTFVGYSGIENAFLFDAVSKLVVATDSSPVHGNDFELCSDMIEVAIDISGIYSFGNPRNHTKEDSIQDSHPVGEESFILDHWNISSSCGYFFQDSSCWCTIRLGNGIVLHMKSVGHYLCLVLMARGEILDSNWGLVGYNIRVFSECLSKVIKSTRCCDA